MFLSFTNINMAKETKACPFCGEDILATAVKCKHCGEFLEKEEDKAEVKVEEKKKGNIWKGILQCVIFLTVWMLSTNWGDKSLLLGVGLFEVVLFWYCFVSWTDKNPICDKAILQRLKSDKTRWVWFIIIGFCFGWMMIGGYTGKYSETIREAQQATTDSMEQGLDDMEQGIKDTTNKAIQEIEEMK